MMDNLYCISENNNSALHLEKIQTLFDAGAKLFQLRLKDVSDEQYMTFARQVKEICDAYQVTLILNDKPAIAKAIQADGVHLGINDPDPSQVRKELGDAFLIGGTANDMNRIADIYEAVDYIGLGPYRHTHTKENLSPVLGSSGFQTIMDGYHRSGMDKPVYAIGGIQPDDVSAILETGVYGVAVAGAVFSSRRIADEVIAFRNQFNKE